MDALSVAAGPRRPNFLFIGADRCGSKWLHRLFQEHPNCYVPAIADPYFFDRQYHRGLDWYLGLFRDVPADAIAVGEFSHDYIHSPAAAERIARDLPGVRLLATLRHPVERAYSDWAHSYEVGVVSTPFEQAWEEVTSIRENGLYADRLEPYWGFFRPDQMHIMLYDHLVADARAFADGAFRFLGVPIIDGLSYHEVFNAFRVSRAGLGGALARTLADWLRASGQVQLLGKLRHQPLIRRIFFKEAEKTSRPPMSAETRKRLLAFYEPQVARLESTLRVDLAAWRR